jgi:hypothetical protein
VTPSTRAAASTSQQVRSIGGAGSRGDVPRAARHQAAALRSRATGLLNRLRQDLAQDVAKTPELPRDLDQRLFGYLDTLVAIRVKPAKKDEPQPAPT